MTRRNQRLDQRKDDNEIAEHVFGGVRPERVSTEKPAADESADRSRRRSAPAKNRKPNGNPKR